MMKQLEVRKASESDSETLIQFNLALAYETEHKKLAREKVEPGVKKLFQYPEYGFYLVACVEDQIVGSLMITTEWSDWRNGLFWWIQSVYVVPDFRRQGVYRSLYQKVRDLAAIGTEVCGCRLYVEKENAPAQQTYTRLGMKELHYKIYEELFRI